MARNIYCMMIVEKNFREEWFEELINSDPYPAFNMLIMQYGPL